MYTKLTVSPRHALQRATGTAVVQHTHPPTSLARIASRMAPESTMSKGRDFIGALKLMLRVGVPSRLRPHCTSDARYYLRDGRGLRTPRATPRRCECNVDDNCGFNDSNCPSNDTGGRRVCRHGHYSERESDGDRSKWGVVFRWRFGEPGYRASIGHRG